jgi:hypothetical protein
MLLDLRPRLLCCRPWNQFRSVPLLVSASSWGSLLGKARTVTSKHRKKPDTRSIWIVVAAFNETAVLSPIVSDLVRRSYRVVVVDDGSHDATGQIAFSAGATVVRHPVNLGQGASLQSGINFNSVACELSFKSVDRNSSDVTKLDASSPQKRTPSGKCLGFLLPHWTGRHGCRGMGVPPILVPEQQCADKVQSRACEV